MLEKDYKIGDYSLVKFLGRGQFGEVWLAEKQLKVSTRKVRHALKFLFNLGDEVNLKAAEAEIDTWIEASGHPNVMPVLDMLIYKEHIIIVSEFAESGSLKSWLDSNGKKAPSNEKAVEMMRGILRGIEHLHSRNIVHRDLKPDNILLQGNFPRIADFGISRIILENSALTKAIGTPAYMSPEAFHGNKSSQTDIWSAGVILYEMLTGIYPFDGETIPALIYAIDSNAPKPLPENIPSQLQEVIYRALEKDCSKRYQTIQDMNEVLKNVWVSIENEAKRKREWEIKQERLKGEEERAGLRKQLEEAEKIAIEERRKREEAEQKRREELERLQHDSENKGEEISSDTLPIKTMTADFAAQIRQREIEGRRRQAREAKENKKPAMMWKIAVGVGSLFFGIALIAVLFATWSQNNTAITNTNTARDAEIVAKYTKAKSLANQALTEMMSGNTVKAKDLATDALQLNKDLPLALAISGAAKRSLGNKEEDYQSALVDLKRAVEFEPSNAFFRSRLFIVYLALEQEELADKEASEVLSLLTAPRSALDYYTRGNSNTYFDKSDDAISDYTKTIELNPQLTLAYIDRGDAHFEKKDYNAAVRDYTKAIELNPQYANAYINRGIAYDEKKDYIAAIRDFTKSIEVNPEYAEAYNNRGLVYSKKSDYNVAIQDFTRAIEVNPQLVQAYQNRGITYFYKRDYNAAIQDFTKGIELDPQNADTYYNRAIAYGKNKDYDAAIRDYTKAIEVNPEYANAYHNRGLTYAAIKQKDLAAADERKFIELKKTMK